MHGRIEAGEIKRRRGNNLRKLKNATRKVWRRGSESNRRVKVLQTSPLPLGYRAPAPYVSVPGEKSPPAESKLGLKRNWSGRRGSNPRHRPWQGRALPLSYSRSTQKLYRICGPESSRVAAATGYRGFPLRELDFNLLRRRVHFHDAKAANLPRPRGLRFGHGTRSTFPARLQHRTQRR